MGWNYFSSPYFHPLFCEGERYNNNRNNKLKGEYYMQWTVDGKNYETDTAKYIGNYRSTIYRDDARFYEETLYRKKTGEFFLYGHGGTQSKYAYISPGGRRNPAQRIIPLTDEAAKVWMQQHGYGEKCATLFE